MDVESGAFEVEAKVADDHHSLAVMQVRRGDELDERNRGGICPSRFGQVSPQGGFPLQGGLPLCVSTTSRKDRHDHSKIQDHLHISSRRAANLPGSRDPWLHPIWCASSFFR